MTTEQQHTRTSLPGAWIPRWLPNAISVARIALIPVWVWCAEASCAAGGDRAAGEDGGARLLALIVLCTIGVSDVVDGYLARRFHLESRVGATLDAVADKLAQVVLIVYFASREPSVFFAVPWWFAIVLFGRDAVIATGCLLIRRRCGRVRVVHRVHGKIASFLIFALLVWITAGWAAAWIEPALYAISALVVVSTVAYVRDGFAQV